MKTMKMKSNIFTMLLPVALILGSCELGRDLFGTAETDARTGALEVDVAVRQPNVTRAGSEDTSLYPVSIVGDGVELHYPSLAQMPQSVRLSVGDYTVSAHSPGTLEKKMTQPWFSGSSDLTISKDITTTTTVTCRMANSRITVNYGPEFLAGFQSWTITVDDGSTTALSFDEGDKAPAPVFWKFEDNTVTAIVVNVRAKTKDGNTISDTRTFKKGNASQQYDDVTDYFAGGDAIEINMGVVAASTGTVSGISVTANISFENHDEYVEIPVGGGETPSGPGASDGPSMALPDNFAYSAANISSRPSSADAVLRTPKGMKSAVVVITTTSPAFEATLAEVDMGGNLLEGVEMVGNKEFDGLFEGVGLPDKAPVAGATEYTFPVGAFFTFLDMFTGTHSFQITITDNEDATATGTLTITVTE